MPYLRVRVATAQKDISTQQIAKGLTDLAVTKLGKAADVAAVDVKFTSPDDWFIGGQSLTETHQTGFFTEIKITEATNTRDEKATFVKAVFDFMAKLYGDLAKTSYVVLQDVASEAWGYGGLTQEYRYIQPNQD
ncbi:4-oxalocrotonate tautomerase [Secundilactobacillus odoratitofui DSM 19909 = JCM 15043]|uniref:4-oxalocrotonate tautomerase n=1 Tax=Secundilactobacillus odoratitofui DSM 19909 = JCM 15043 TaxID=1423776 RepID=A0A0R1LSQ5_9LACO|nr:tautomerase family protein [Secundilactobacillus odoratitofui]KRK98717.1 4-oxalocrotonate tautomerase [Secundilactobacillus odoratitofui DSM 19909 = JCM 15043]